MPVHHLVQSLTRQLPVARESRAEPATPSLALLFGSFPLTAPCAFPRRRRRSWRSPLHWARETGKQVVHPCHPHPPEPCAAAQATEEPNNITHLSACWSSHRQCLQVRASCLPHHIPGPTPCQPPASPPPARGSQSKVTVSEQTSKGRRAALFCYPGPLPC